MKKIISFFISTCLCFFCCHAQNNTQNNLLHNLVSTPIQNLELPQISEHQKIISHIGYSFVYNENHEQADWVAYLLTKQETNKSFERTNKFLTDPAVATETANNSDYAKSGYDKGHLAPAADMSWSEVTMAQSFYFSNMSPQDPGFNRGIWKKLEELVRTWAIQNDSIYIAVGPVLTHGLLSIGENKVSIPKYYYKVILDYTNPKIKAIGFIFPNASSSLPLQNFAVTIDSVEKFTGLNFFSRLPPEQEKLIEKTLCLDCWSWKKTSTVNKTNTAISATQCTATTKQGKRCKRTTKSASGKCKQHEQN